MTSTKPAKPTLPEHKGEPVDAAQIKFGGLGTGFQGLDVEPIFMDLDDVGYFVMKAEAKESPSAKRDSKDRLFWLNRVTVASMAPIDKATAERVLAEYTEEIQRKRDEVDGQLRLDEERQAEEREAADRQASGSRRNTQLSSVPQPEFSQADS